MMAECYYSYFFDLEDCLIKEEILDKNAFSPMRAVGLSAPLNFDDFVDVWKSLCFPVFTNADDEDKLTCKYFKEAYKRGETDIAIALEHNPLRNTYAAKDTCVRIKLFRDEKTRRARAHVMWEDNSQHRI